jgi:hypothetical protein
MSSLMRRRSESTGSGAEPARIPLSLSMYAVTSEYSSRDSDPGDESGMVVRIRSNRS